MVTFNPFAASEAKARIHSFGLVRQLPWSRHLTKVGAGFASVSAIVAVWVFTRQEELTSSHTAASDENGGPRSVVAAR